MSQKTDLESLKKRAFLNYHQDGLLDIVLGLMILGFGMMMATDSSAFMFLSWMPILFYAPFKQRITVPRLGYVRFDDERTTKIRYGWILLTGLSVLCLFVGIYVFTTGDTMSATLSGLMDKFYMLLLGGFFAVGMVVGGLFTGLWRLYIYAVLTILIIIVGITLGIPESIYMITIGTMILTVGVWHLVTFVRKYPAVSEEYPYDSQ